MKERSVEGMMVAVCVGEEGMKIAVCAGQG